MSFSQTAELGLSLLRLSWSSCYVSPHYCLLAGGYNPLLSPNSLPMECSVKHGFAERWRVFPGESNSWKCTFPDLCTATSHLRDLRRVSCRTTASLPPAKGQLCLQTAGVRVPSSEDTSIPSQMLHNCVNMGRSESFKPNLELSFWREVKLLLHRLNSILSYRQINHKINWSSVTEGKTFCHGFSQHECYICLDYRVK